MNLQSVSATANRQVPARDEALEFVSAASFWFPQRTSVGSGWAEHAPFAFWLIDALRPKTLVELGTHKGYSFAAFCQAVQRLQLDTRCFAVDTWQGDVHAGFYSDAVFDELHAYLNDTYSGFARMVRSTFDEALAHFDDGSVDLLHIDGRHLYEDARHDYSTWRPKLAPNAVVLFHDINVREHGFGVYRLWEELQLEHPSFEFRHGNGLGVLGFGGKLPERVQRFLAFARDAEGATVLRDIYARLGRAISHHFEIAHRGPDVVGALRGGIAERDEEIIRLRAERDALKQENRLLKHGVAAAQAQSDIANGIDRDAIIERLREDSSRQAETIKALQKSLAEANVRFSAARAAKS